MSSTVVSNRFDLTSLGLILGIGLLAIALRVWMGKGAWIHHIGQSKGYIRDEITRMAAILVPAIAMGGLVRLYMTVSQKQDINPITLSLGVVLAVVVGRLASRTFAPVRDATLRIRNARQAFYDAKVSSK
jgi:hypothetical protein